MRDPTRPVHIRPDALYDDGALVLVLGVTHRALARARRRGDLRHSRSGRKVHYRGQWVMDWLDTQARPSIRKEVGNG